MAFKEVLSMNCDETVGLGGINKKTGKPNPTKLEGYFVGSKEVESKMASSGTCKIHIFQTPKGTVGVWGKTDLDRKMLSATVGAMTRVTQNGKLEIPGRNPMYKFKVEVDTANTIDVATIATESHSEQEETGSYSSVSDDYEEAALDAEEASLDEVQPVRASAPKRPIATPDAARQARVKELLNSRRS